MNTHTPRAQQHRDESDRALQVGIGVGQGHHGADHDDAVHEVRAGHERRMQDHRHARDDLVAEDGREQENVKRQKPVHQRASP